MYLTANENKGANTMATSQALAAKAIRAELKEMGVKGRVTSKGYSMGCSVNVSLTDENPETVKKVKDAAAKYQYGHFNGMEDIYEYSNGREDLPQAKFVFVDNNTSDELKQKAWDYIRTNFAERPARTKCSGYQHYTAAAAFCIWVWYRYADQPIKGEQRRQYKRARNRKPQAGDIVAHYIAPYITY
jgi:hypothetical protein